MHNYAIIIQNSCTFYQLCSSSERQHVYQPLQSLEVLLDHGVSPYVTDADGLRPTDLAEECGHKQCVELLAKYEKMLPPVQTAVDQVCTTEIDLKSNTNWFQLVIVKHLILKLSNRTVKDIILEQSLFKYPVNFMTGHTLYCS